jgi:uncharacterized protein (TIGR02444 family)
MPNEPQNFWNFSLELYDREGVAKACLELQNSHGLDVNLILCCFWLARNYGEADRQLLHELIEYSQIWRKHVVQPLRSARSWMKSHADNRDSFIRLREGIKAEELQAEKYQQEQLASRTHEFFRSREPQWGSDDIATNINRLLRTLDIERDEKLTLQLEIIRSQLGD